jgi:predicted dehydrogenase
MRAIRWGILATGGIATKFTEDLRLIPDAIAVAVASRTVDGATRFAEAHGIERAYGSWQALADDPDVDIVYVGTPHVAHYDAAKLMLEHGKAVLCEKPLTLNARQAEELVALARVQQVFFAEAMWMRTMPAMRRVTELVRSGAIGEVSFVSADFSFQAAADPAHRLRNPALGGGALLDLGVYPISLAQMVLGDPSAVRGSARLTPEGVDETTGVLLSYPSGAIATATCSIATVGPTTATIAGSSGMIVLPAGFHHAQHLTWHRLGADEREPFSFEGNGLRFQAIEAIRCMREGLTESPLLPLDDTLTVMRTMDEVRRQVGVVYPGEEA